MATERRRLLLAAATGALAGAGLAPLSAPAAAEVLPGPTMAGDVGRFDDDVERRGDDLGGDDQGWQALGRLGLTF